MIKTIYKCDKCGNEQYAADQFWNVIISAGSVHFSQNTVKRIMVCRPCLESFGIHVTKQKDTEPPKPPTIEELLREIINMGLINPIPLIKVMP